MGLERLAVVCQDYGKDDFRRNAKVILAKSRTMKLASNSKSTIPGDTFHSPDK